MLVLDTHALIWAHTGIRIPKKIGKRIETFLDLGAQTRDQGDSFRDLQDGPRLECRTRRRILIKR